MVQFFASEGGPLPGAPTVADPLMNSKKLRRPKSSESPASREEDEFRNEVDTALETLPKKQRDILISRFLTPEAANAEPPVDPDDLLDGKSLSETRGDTAQALRSLIRYSRRLQRQAAEAGDSVSDDDGTEENEDGSDE